MVIAVSLYWTQIVRGKSYATKANEQYVKPLNTLFDRGSMYFQSKDGTKASAATLESGFIIFMNPTVIANPVQVYEALSQYIKLNETDFLAKAGKPNSHYEVLVDQTDAVVAQSVKNLLINGVSVIPKTWRSYPGGSLAAHTLGIVGEDSKSSSVTGRYGLERVYEDVLSRSGSSNNINVFAELFSGLRNTIFGGSSKKEGDIIMTVEPTVERYLERVLVQTNTIWRPDEIGGIVIDPKTGEIIAMSSLPTFNPNNTSSIKNISILSNPLVESAYEMGSIMKPLTMAAALDSGTEKPHSTYDDTGTMTLSGKKISNYDGKARGIIPMQEILSQSLNVGAATIALKMGKEVFVKYFTEFGLGEKTGIDQPFESAGIATNLKTGRDVEIATMAYGQGISISPISMTRVLSVLANGGYLVTPHLMKEIDYSDGTIKKNQPQRSGPVLSKETTDSVTGMLVKVVDEKIAVSHPNIRMERYSIAAKTGTAQIADKSGGYYSDRYLHSFFGYFPAYDPEFLVFLYQVYPKGAEYASETLTDPFSDLAKFLISYYNIVPDR